MAIFHFSVDVIRRSKGRSSVAASAYRSGTKLKDEKYKTTHNYEAKQVDDCFVMLPQNAPVRFIDRQTLWNEVERVETHSKAQVARDINFALPIELSHEEQKKMVKEFVQENFVEQGMICDVAIHRDNPANPHCHLLLTMRGVNENGFEKTKTSTRHWNNQENTTIWREKFAGITNKYLMENGIEHKVDHRSLEEQGIERVPQIHEGWVARDMEKNGIKSDRVQINEEIKKLNEEIANLEKQEYEVQKELLQDKLFQLYEMESLLSGERVKHESNFNKFKDKKKKLLKKKEDLPKLKQKTKKDIEKLTPKNKFFSFFMSKNKKDKLNNSIETFNNLNKEERSIPGDVLMCEEQMEFHKNEMTKKQKAMTKLVQKRTDIKTEMKKLKEKQISNSFNKEKEKNKKKNTERQI